MSNTVTKKPVASIMLIIGIICMLVGSIMSHSAITGNGTVDVQSIEWVNENGASQHAVLYIPKNASAQNKVPGIVANHGFSANSEAMHLHAIEMSRRGYVVIAPDAYAHGKTSYPDMTIEGGVVNDMGNYSALQFLGRLPYVDTENIGMIGHSMGSDCSRFSALRAFAEKDAGNENVIVPKSILLTSNSFKAVAADSTGSVLGAEQGGEKVDPINAYPVNYATIFGQFDEFAGMMWGNPDGAKFKESPQFAVGMGFEGAEYNTFYAYGENTPLSREAAIEAGNAKTLRAGWSVALTHAFTLFSPEPVALALEFFDVTLSNGTLASSTFAYDDQIWMIKPAGGMIALVGLVMFIVSLGYILLKGSFKSLEAPEGRSMSTLTTSSDKIRYTVVYLVLSACAPLLYTWSCGLALYNPFQGVIVPVKFIASETFQLPIINGIVLMNMILSVIFVAAFAFFYSKEKKNGYTLKDAGVLVSKETFVKSVLLAISLFAIIYALVYVAETFFHAEFGAFKLVLMHMPAYKWTVFLKYVPFFLVYFVIHSLIVNSLTRINGTKEWINMALIILTTVGGLAILQAYDIGMLRFTGVKGIATVPGTSDPNALSGITLWGTLMVLPITAIISRCFFKKTGNIWVGGILNGLLVAFACVCGTCIMFQ